MLAACAGCPRSVRSRSARRHHHERSCRSSGDGLSGRFAVALRDEPACDFTIHRIAAVELHEPHRAMYAHRGLLSSAAIARPSTLAGLHSEQRRLPRRRAARKPLLVTVETGVKVTM